MGQMKAFMEMQRGGKAQKSSISKKYFIYCSGVFDQLAEDVKKRLDLNRIGFGSTEEGQEAELTFQFLSKLRPETL